MRKTFFAFITAHIFLVYVPRQCGTCSIQRLSTHTQICRSNLLSRHFCDGPFTVPFHPENTEMCVIHQNFPELKRLDSPVICKIRHLLLVGTHSRVDSFVRFFFGCGVHIWWQIHNSSTVTFMDFAKMIEQYFLTKEELPLYLLVVV